MYELILYMCLKTAVVCDMHHAAGKQFHVYLVEKREDCAAKQIEIDEATPDPPYATSHYKCQAIEEPL